MPLQPGVTMRLPDVCHLPGRWQVWGQTNDGPGAHAFVPADDVARATGVKYAIIRVKFVRSAVEPVLTLLRVDPPTAVEVTT